MRGGYSPVIYGPGGYAKNIATGGTATSYTPTFTGFGTVSGISARWSKIGSYVYIEGVATAGTSTATEARISLPSGLTSSSTIGTLEIAGQFTITGNVAGAFYTMKEASVAYITISAATGTTSAMTKKNGNTIIASDVFAFNAMVPIEGW